MEESDKIEKYIKITVLKINFKNKKYCNGQNELFLQHSIYTNNLYKLLQRHFKYVIFDIQIKTEYFEARKGESYGKKF